MNTEVTAQTTPTPLEELPARLFRMGAVELPDPDPTLPPLEALRLYAPNYPHLASATLSEPDFRDGQLIFEVEKPPVKTKGATPNVVAPREVDTILDAWIRGEPHTLPAESNHNTDTSPPCTLNTSQLHRLQSLLSHGPSARPLRQPPEWFPLP